MKIKVENLKDLEILVNVSEEQTEKLYDVLFNIRKEIEFNDNGVEHIDIHSIDIVNEFDDDGNGFTTLKLCGCLHLDAGGKLLCKISLPRVCDFI